MLRFLVLALGLAETVGGICASGGRPQPIRKLVIERINKVMDRLGGINIILDRDASPSFLVVEDFFKRRVGACQSRADATQLHCDYSNDFAAR